MRFTIRDLMWLTVVAALLMGWAVSNTRLRSDLVRAAEQAGTSARWEGYAGALREQLGEFGIPVEFRKDGGMSIGPIPPELTPPPRQLPDPN